MTLNSIRRKINRKSIKKAVKATAHTAVVVGKFTGRTAAMAAGLVVLSILLRSPVFVALMFAGLVIKVVEQDAKIASMQI